ncbi:unnamed protein product [Parajaminaea phylloscopi]
MSNIYMTEPPTSGRIVLVTSKGDVEIELWAKETPKACRNIIALALEGYYDNMLWHRVVPNFCIQTGDPTGTGTGGESFYGEPFGDEPHQRLKFSRRGLVAMANPGEPNHNESQFFITLDATPELQNKHTIFGKVSGATIFNVLALAEVELSETEPDRPIFPPKVHTVRVLDNPFPDIVPRITRQEKLAQEAARKRARLETNTRKEKVEKKIGLLSFGDEEEPEGDIDPRLKGAKSSHDLLKNDRRLRPGIGAATDASSHPRREVTTVTHARGSDTGQSAEAQPTSSRERRELSPQRSTIDLAAIRASHQSSSVGKDAAAEIEVLEASIKGMSKRRNGLAEPEASEGKKARTGKTLLAEARRKYTGAASYSSSRGRPDERERETMALLRKFQTSSSKSTKSKGEDVAPTGASGSGHASQSGQAAREDAYDADADTEAGMREYGASDDETDDATSWRSHRFEFGGKAIHESKDSADTYVTLDPRDTASAAATSLGFGSADAQKRAKEDKIRSEGRRGRDYLGDRELNRNGSSRRTEEFRRRERPSDRRQ